MKMKTILTILFLLIIVPSFATFAQKPDFSGEWKINKEKTVLPENQLFLSAITIQFKNDSLFTERVYVNGNGDEYPFIENLSLDGKDCKMVIYEMPRTTKVARSSSEGSLMFESSTIFQGNNGADTLSAKETLKIDTEGKILTMDFTNKSSAGETSGTNYYNKAK